MEERTTNMQPVVVLEGATEEVDERATNMQPAVVLERMEEPNRTSHRSRQLPEYLQDYNCSSIKTCMTSQESFKIKHCDRTTTPTLLHMIARLTRKFNQVNRKWCYRLVTGLATLIMHGQGQRLTRNCYILWEKGYRRSHFGEYGMTTPDGFYWNPRPK